MTKTRISLSISPDVLGRLDRVVDGQRIKSRSEAVEVLIEQSLSETKHCVILAGGSHERLRWRNTYRPLIKIGHKTLIEHIIGKVAKAGIGEFLVVGSKEVLSEIFKVAGEHYGQSRIRYITEDKHLGSAKTLQLAKEPIKSRFVFVPCDHFFEIDIAGMEKYHCSGNSMATLAVYSGNELAWTGTSMVEIEGNLIKKYIEKPKTNLTSLTALMIGWAEPEIFDYIPESDISYSLQEDLFPAIAKKAKLAAYLYGGKWMNVHNEKQAAVIEKHLTQHQQ